MKPLQVKTVPVKIIGVATLILAFFACQKEDSRHNKDNSAGTSTAVHVFLTDDPSFVFDNVFLDIQKVEIKAEDNDQAENEHKHQQDVDDNDDHGDTSGGWVTLDIHPGIYDILKFRNGLDTLFATGSFPNTHELKKVRVTLGNNNSIVLNGQSFPLFAKDNDNIIVIKLDDNFTNLGSLGQLEFSLDFDAARSISLHGDRFELRAEIKAFRKEKAGSIEGRVLPGDAHALVMAINGTDTASAKPEAEGEFEIVGLKAGDYSVVYHATANNYQDTTIQHVTVSAHEDTHISAITLHK